MLEFIRDERQLLIMAAIWVGSSIFLGPLALAIIPLTFILLRRAEAWPELLMGMLVILVLSDMRKDIHAMLVFKSVKNVCVLLLLAFFLMRREEFKPHPRVFPIFLPFFIYSILPLVFSSTLITSVQKTISYALMFLIVPNYVLYNFRSQGWSFFRNLVFLAVTLLAIGILLRYVDFRLAYVAGRFHGLFGNPNGVAIFCFLSFMLMATVTHIRRDLFSTTEKVFIYGVIIYSLILSGSRASLAAVAIFLVISRFFAYSPFLGFVVLIASVGVVEVVTSNLGAIITWLGLEEYFRLQTLEEGSGRYFAWEFAWRKLQPYYFFGGGWANDEFVMRSRYSYLEKMGHQGGVHNSYLSMWFNVGIVGIIIYFRSFILLFIKASKLTGMAVAVMFATLFSITYESWLVGSLNPYTIMLLIILTMISEEEIALGADPLVDDAEESATEEEPPPLGLRPQQA